MRSSCLKLDWLHIADQGVTAFLMGSILCLFVDPPGQPDFGSTIAARALTIWHLMDRWYRDNKVATDRLKSLPVTRFRTKPPCLNGQGAIVRKLVPFFVHLMTLHVPGFLGYEVVRHRLCTGRRASMLLEDKGHKALMQHGWGSERQAHILCICAALPPSGCQ